MPLFAVHSYDCQPDGPALRAANRDAHLAFLRDFGSRLRMGGPLIGSDGETMIGSLLLVEAVNRAALIEELKNDPYAKAGLVHRTDVTEVKWVIGEGKQ